ncbi:MAG: hypothetical protein JW730_08845 [Anaerolineales bacterium]|nr:hypothetical protein [Anaerolineales bacterium]
MAQTQPVQYAPCPNCGNTNVKKINYTWWGGILGPAILTHVKCNNCGTQYNGKTGKSNTVAIILLFVIGLIIGLCLYAGFVYLTGS